MAVTIKEIASTAGVSRGTVDKVIHNRPGLRPETVARVQKVLEDLNYTPDPLAKALVEKNDPRRIGVILTPDYNPFIQEMLKGIQRAKDEFQFFGLEIELYLSQSLEIQEQIDALEHFRESEVDGVALFPINDSRVADKANELIDAGIPIMTFNSRNTQIHDLCFLGQDHYKAGKIAAGLMHRELPQGGSVAVIISTEMLSCHTERLNGFRKQLAEYDPAISIIDVQENQDRAELSEEIAVSYFRQYPHLDGIYITGGGKGGLVPAVRSRSLADKHCVLIGHDLTANAVTMLREQVADYIINQRADDQGYLIVKTLFEYLFKDVEPLPFYEIPIELMIRESL